MSDDPIDRFLTTDPNGDPNWKPLWGKGGSMSYGETIPTPQAAIRAFFRVARTLKSLIDSAPKTKDGVQFGSTRAIRAELAKLTILGLIAKQCFYTLEKLSSPTKSVTTSVHAPHFAHEGAIQIISQVAMLPLGTDLQSDSTLTIEQVDLFNRRFIALEDLVDRLKPDSEPAGSQADTAEADLRPARWFTRATRGTLTGDTLRKAVGRESLVQSVQQTKGSEWFHSVEEVCSEYPQYMLKIREAQEKEQD